MDTNRPAPLDLAARDRATRRLNQLTTGVALAGVLSVAGFGALAAATNTGTTVTTTASVTTDTSGSGTTTTTPSLGGGLAPSSVSGPAHATTGGS
jgi:hypothetical protein